MATKAGRKAKYSGILSLGLVNGGINVRSGQMTLKKNQTKKAANISLLLEGGFTKTPGFTAVCTLPTPIQGLMLYERGGIASSPKGQISFEMLAYHYSSISRVDVRTGTFTTIKNNLKAEGRPQYAQDNAGNMHIVDGVNTPVYFNGSTISNVTWPPVYTATQSTQLPGSILAGTGANYAFLGNVIDCTFYQNRMWYVTDIDPAIVAYSKSSKTGGTASTDFQTNDGSSTPVDIAGYATLPAITPFTGIEATPNGMLMYGQNSTGRLLGQNPFGLGLPDPFRYETINSTIGLLSPHLLGKMSDNEQIVVANNGVFVITLSDNFQEVRPGQMSYDVQPIFDAIGRYNMSTGRLLIAPHSGIAILAIPRNNTSLQRNALWVLHFGVGAKAKPKTLPWMLNEEFSGTPTSINDMVVDPSDNTIYLAVGDTIYKWSGTSYFNSGSIRSEYQFAPNDFGFPSINKYISAYNITYKSITGATFRLDHAWDNQDGGSTTVTVPAKTVPLIDSAIIGTDKLSFRSAFKDSAYRFPIAGGQIGKNFILTFLHDSATEDLTIYDIQVEYDVLGEGA